MQLQVAQNRLAIAWLHSSANSPRGKTAIFGFRFTRGWRLADYLHGRIHPCDALTLAELDDVNGIDVVFYHATGRAQWAMESTGT